MSSRQVYDMGEWFRNKYNGLLNDCHWNRLQLILFTQQSFFQSKNFEKLGSTEIGR